MKIGIVAMPELPEVETVVRTIAPRLVGRRIRNVWLGASRVLSAPPDEFTERITGRLVAGVRRHGKNILIDLEDGQTILVHLGMTGKLVPFTARGPHTRAVLELDDGAVEYNDIRQFGRLDMLAAEKLSHLGPDALDLPLDTFREMLGRRSGRIKAVLLDQRLISGIGNIYADEILFLAGVHPLTPAARLSRKRAERLWHAMNETLAAAILSGGSSVSNYVDGEGRKGEFQNRHQVYRKTGHPCPRCLTPIRRILVAQRGTHYCPRCQRA